MADIINLRQARKAKARLEKEKKADANRAFHGMSKAEKTKNREEKRKLSRHIDNHKLSDDDQS